MPTRDGMGYGACTETKLRHLRTILEMHIAVTNAVRNRWPSWRQRPYHYIDATAGRGIVPGYRLKGSPLLAIELLDGTTSYRADLIEAHPKNYGFLSAELVDHYANHAVHLHAGKYEVVLPQLLDLVNLPLGLIFFDPSGDMLHWPTLQLFAKRRQRMEMLLYLPATNIKRARRHNIPLLCDCLAGIDKTHWMVREPLGKHQWTFLLGSNWDQWKDYKRIGFYRSDSDEGQDILFRLNYTTRETQGWLQPTLPLIEPMLNISDIPPILQSKEKP